MFISEKKTKAMMSEACYALASNNAFLAHPESNPKSRPLPTAAQAHLPHLMLPRSPPATWDSWGSCHPSEPLQVHCLKTVLYSLPSLLHVTQVSAQRPPPQRSPPPHRSSCGPPLGLNPSPADLQFMSEVSRGPPFSGRFLCMAQCLLSMDQNGLITCQEKPRECCDLHVQRGN